MFTEMREIMNRQHCFCGKWIADDEFFNIKPRNVFHRQLEKVNIPCDERRDCHTLFRKQFDYNRDFTSATIYISADDYYKLYINGQFVAQGPAPAYHFEYNYNVIDVHPYLVKGKNTIAVHTLYQGLINRVWQSGDNRHGLILDLDIDGDNVLASDETFKTHRHSAYSETGVVGNQTQFLETYDSRSAEVGFADMNFDDSSWEYAKIHHFDDHCLKEQISSMLVFEKKLPVKEKWNGNSVLIDFGSNYVGYLVMTAIGKGGDVVTVRCGQELDEDGNVRFILRANCKYEETWILSDGESSLDWFDYKSFRYAQICIPDGCALSGVHMNVRHYPFTLQANLKEKYASDAQLKKVWNLCVHTQQYGVQEVIQDCMEREKGFYVGDGCYTALTHMILTRDDSIVKKLIHDSFSSGFITDGLVTCLDCSFMQEIAEYPLMLVYLILWHYNFTGDREFLEENYAKVVLLLDSYRRNYEKNFLLNNLDRWCVVEWPKNFQDNYDADISEGKVCRDVHISINAYYIAAIKAANRISEILKLPLYRDENPLKDAFMSAFYDKERHLFKDSESSDHISLIGNVFPFAFELCPDDECKNNIIQMLEHRGIHSLSMFGTFLALMGYIRSHREDLVEASLRDEGAWLRMLREGATTTFESWGKNTKWNTSLFHMTFSYAAAFMADFDLNSIF